MRVNLGDAHSIDFEEVCNKMYLPLYYHTDHFQYPKNPLVFAYLPLPSLFNKF